ncbi:MAG TPA: hypothetical protein VFP43_23310, partial [Mesorhizobium sp.]|nr:hypothetical protein [Mesorhizobium sp.]
MAVAVFVLAVSLRSASYFCLLLLILAIDLHDHRAVLTHLPVLLRGNARILDNAIPLINFSLE